MSSSNGVAPMAIDPPAPASTNGKDDTGHASDASSSAPLASTKHPQPQQQQQSSASSSTLVSSFTSSRARQRIADSDDDDDEGQPLSRSRPSQLSQPSSQPTIPDSTQGTDAGARDDSDEDSDVPLKAATRNGARRKADKDDDDDDDQGDNDDDEGNGGYDENEGGDDDDDDDDDDGGGGDDTDAASTTSKASKASKAGTRAVNALRKTAKTVAKRLTGRADKKWETLYHKGPRFPPPYEPLPSSVKLKYDGKPVSLPPEAEEAAMFYAIKIETDYVKKPTNAAIFNKNFFDDWKKILAKHPPGNGVKITDFSKCDFRDMYEHFRELRDAENERKKSMAPSERKNEIEQKKLAEADFRTCVVDGVEQKVGNFTVEPPGLFLGRGAHPKMGKIKKRIRPEDITINHTKNDPKHPPPAPPKGHRWAEVVTIKDKTWLASWIENVNKQNKYMYLDSSSLFKTNSDRDKFEKARKLDNHVRQLRAEYEGMLTSKSRSERELGTVIWLIDVWSLRVGNEKNAEEEAETYGACSLLKEHITCLPVTNPETDPHWVKLSFLGKDSMKFEGQNVATPRIYKNLQMFSKGFKDTKGNTIIKKGSDPLFMTVDPSRVNKFMTGHMPGLSAKVFRTYNASVTFQALLDRTDYWLAAQPDPDRRVLSPANLKLAYEAANYQVAVLCNHQRTLNQQQVEQAENRTANKRFAVLYDRYKLRQLLLTGNTPAELKKTYKTHPFAKRWAEILEEVPIDDEQIKEHEELQATQRKEKLNKRYERDQLEEKYQAKLKRESTPEVKKKGGGSAAAARMNGKGNKKGKAVVEDSEAEPESEHDEDGKKKFLSKEQRDEQLRAIDERLKVLAKERKTGKAEEASGNVPGVCKRILACVEKLKTIEAEAEAKMKTSDVALGTSKLNYIDPRITVAWLKKYDERLQEEALKDPTSKLSREVAKAKEEEELAAKLAKTAGKGGKKGGKKGVKKEESEEEEEAEEDELKPNGRKRGRASEAVNGTSPARKRAKAENGTPIPTASGKIGGGGGGGRTNLNAVGDSEKMELDLKILTLSNYFPNTMQKKFKWAATDDDDLDLRPGWQFVKDPWAKMRKPARKENSKADNVDMWEDPVPGAKVKSTGKGGKEGVKVELETSLEAAMPSKAAQAAAITGPAARKKVGVGAVGKRGKVKKEESDEDEEMPPAEDEDDDDEDDDAPLVATTSSTRARVPSARAAAGRASARLVAESEEDDDDDEEKPLAARKAPNGESAKAKAAKVEQEENGDDEDEDDDVPLGRK